MTSKKQIAANRNNAKKSTGPKTQQGKAVSSKNATKHGLLSQHLLLPDECELQLEQFHSQLIEQLSPANQLESLLAERIIATAWRLRRIQRIETEMMTNDLQPKKPKWQLSLNSLSPPDENLTLGAAIAKNATNIDTYDKLRRYEAHIERSLFRNLHILKILKTTRNENSNE